MRPLLCIRCGLTPVPAEPGAHSGKQPALLCAPCALEAAAEVVYRTEVTISDNQETIQSILELTLEHA